MAPGLKRTISHLTSSPIVATTMPPLVPTSNEDTNDSKRFPTFITSNSYNFVRCFIDFA